MKSLNALKTICLMDWTIIRFRLKRLLKPFRNFQLYRLIRKYEREARELAAAKLYRSAAFNKFMAERLRRELI